MGLEMSGMDQIRAALESMTISEADFDNALKKAGEPISEAMIQMAPKGATGILKGAIKVGAVKGGKNGRAVTIGAHRKDFKGEYYAPYVEYGHGGPHPAGPHPFARPAFDATQDQAYGILKDSLSEAMKDRS